MPADIPDYTCRYPDYAFRNTRLYLQISKIIATDILDYTSRYPRLYLEISQIKLADIPGYPCRYSRL